MRITLRVLASIAAGCLVLFVVVMLASLVPVGTTTTSATTATSAHDGLQALAQQSIGLCSEWSAELGSVPHAAFRLHAMGCSHATGTWARGKSHCSVIAYDYASARRTGPFDYGVIGRQSCVLTTNGSWVRE